VNQRLKGVEGKKERKKERKMAPGDERKGD